MTCRDFITYLSDYLAGELHPDELAVFEAHLAECPACVAYVRTYQQAIRLGVATLGESDDTVPNEVPRELCEAILAARRANPGS